MKSKERGGRSEGREGEPERPIDREPMPPLAPEDEPRPGFGDTAAERGTRGPVEVMADAE